MHKERQKVLGLGQFVCTISHSRVQKVSAAVVGAEEGRGKVDAGVWGKLAREQQVRFVWMR